jgi:hypothetical protein
MVDYSPKECLKRANEQLAINSAITDRYAALELRQCIEAIAYKKLAAYKNRMPQVLFEKWQPDKVISCLTALEPRSGLDSKTSISRQDLNGKPEKLICSFEQKEITTKFIKDRYHKVGNWLHVPLESTIIDNAKRHEDLVGLVKELTEYVSISIYSTIAHVIVFDCTECKNQIVRNSASLNSGDVVECFNKNCQAKYLIESDGDTFRYILDEAEFECDCGEKIHLPFHKIKENLTVNCLNCKAKYNFSMNWQVVKIE